jgi:PEP-CTERM motif
MRILGLLAALSIAMPAMAANLVTNGDFEADIGLGTQQLWFGGGGTLTGWNWNGLNWYYPDLVAAQTNGITGQVYGPLNGQNNGLSLSPTGGAFMTLDGDANFPGLLTQSIAGLTAGKQYSVKFSWAGAQQAGFTGSTWAKGLTVSLGNQSYSTNEVAGPEGSFQPWRTEFATFTAGSSTETLSFLARGMPSGLPPFVLVDGISLNAVPEPSSWAMLIMGFGMVGAMARRRKALAAA